MFTFHGAGSYGAGQLFYSGFDAVAEDNDFIVVAPNHGVSALGDFRAPTTDLLAEAILDHMVANFSIDESRVYASGISMGGVASQTVATNPVGERFAGIAPVAIGLNVLLDNALIRPMPVISFYGTEDNAYPGVFDEALLKLADEIGADLNPRIDELWPATEDDITSITRYTYSGGINGTEIVFYQVNNGGHTWPGKYQYASLITVGLTSQHLDATEVIWEHLSQHSLPAP